MRWSLTPLSRSLWFLAKLLLFAALSPAGRPLQLHMKPVCIAPWSADISTLYHSNSLAMRTGISCHHCPRVPMFHVAIISFFVFMEMLFSCVFRLRLSMSLTHRFRRNGLFLGYLFWTPPLCRGKLSDPKQGCFVVSWSSCCQNSESCPIREATYLSWSPTCMMSTRVLVHPYLDPTVNTPLTEGFCSNPWRINKVNRSAWRNL